jgi:hypothetical protein
LVLFRLHRRTLWEQQNNDRHERYAGEKQHYALMRRILGVTSAVAGAGIHEMKSYQKAERMVKRKRDQDRGSLYRAVGYGA